MRLGASLVVLLGLLATGPAPVAQAASAPSAVYSPAQARLVASATSPLCKAVSAAAVSHVVGYSLPAPTSTVNTQTDKKLNITGTFTDCTYGTYGSGSPTVDLVYETLSRAVPLSTFQQVIQATVKQMPGADISVKPYAGLGHPALSVTITQGQLQQSGRRDRSRQREESRGRRCGVSRAASQGAPAALEGGCVDEIGNGKVLLSARRDLGARWCSLREPPLFPTERT